MCLFFSNNFSLRHKTGRPLKETNYRGHYTINKSKSWQWKARHCTFSFECNHSKCETVNTIVQNYQSKTVGHPLLFIYKIENAVLHTHTHIHAKVVRDPTLKFSVQHNSCEKKRKDSACGELKIIKYRRRICCNNY